MKYPLQRFVQKHERLTVGILLFLALTVAGGGYALYTLYTDLVGTRAEFASTKASLENTIEDINRHRHDLEEALYSEQQKNAQFEQQIEDIADAVGTLEKWSKLDPELLQKYSRVYFLNEHYVPSRLTKIDEDFYTEAETEKLEIHAGVAPLLDDLLEEADDDGLDLRVASAYRSFGTQSSLKASYSFTYGAGTANQFSADQGYSEHQLGTTVDFTTPETDATFAGFEDTEEYEWLLDNAHKYGFTLSYPEDNGYYLFEPWHWRFVGRDLARYLDQENLHFYDLDQRKINEYLVNIFD